MTVSARRATGACLAILSVFGAQAALAQASRDPRFETVIVTGERTGFDLPSKIESVTAADAAIQVNAVNTEDMLKYLPSVLVRKRHYGDTQDPIATRTSGVGASARSLIFADGILLSSPIGNNNSGASPHWGLVAPQDVAQIDVLYGPFAAEYAGNSIGAVINITTRMPDRFELHADAMGAVQKYNQYATDNSYGTWQVAGGIGDRDGAFAWRLSANHLESWGQPLGYVTLTRPAATSGAGMAVTGAFNDLNRTGAPIVEIGASGLEHQVQDTDTLKLVYDAPDFGTLAYTVSVFHQGDDFGIRNYLKDAGANPVYTGSVNIGGYNYNIAASSFSNSVYNTAQTYLAQALSLKSAGAGDFAWEVIATSYNYLDDNQRVPAGALPGAYAGGAGNITRLTGTGWYTLDAKGVWRGWSANELSFGFHRDQEMFAQSRFNTADWIAGAPGTLAVQAKGRTATSAIWAQDIWTILSELKATLGARFEDWTAYDGVNFSASPSLNVKQPEISGRFFSPKASLAWLPAAEWTVTASYGGAYRMPTVTELYQAIATGTVLTVPNPNLKPEHANSYELAAEHATAEGRVRLSLFEEQVGNALISQSAPLVAGSTTLFGYVQNVDRVRSRGIELVAEQNDLLIEGVQLSGSVTVVDSHIEKDSAFAAAVGKNMPQVPKWRGNLVVTYRPAALEGRLAVTVAARASTRSYGTLDNSDPVTHTYQGFEDYFVADARVHYRLDENWSAAIGLDNITNDKYFLFHPFPQRTLVMEIHYLQ